MTTRRRIVTFALAAVAAMALACGPDGDLPNDPQGDGGMPAPVETKVTKKGDRPGCPNIEFRAEDERCFVIQTFVESRLGPYDVYISIEGGTGAYPPHVPIAAGGWTHAVVYRTGVKMRVKVTVHYEGEQSKDGFCSLTDGGELYKAKIRSITAGNNSPYEAFCEMMTSQ